MTIPASQRVLAVYREADCVLSYQNALTAAGVDAAFTPPQSQLTLDGFAGLVLTGGSDVDPALYGEALGEHTEPPDPERDRVESALLQQALLLDLPVLAICRGLQLMNVFHGGTLHQHLEPVERHRRVAGTRAEPIHDVTINDDSLLGRIVGGQSCAVNSRHHQAIAKLGDGLRITARAPDGIIEAIERPDKLFVVAVQWHPEDQVFQFPEQLALFTQFGEACAAAYHTDKVELQR